MFQRMCSQCLTVHATCQLIRRKQSMRCSLDWIIQDHFRVFFLPTLSFANKLWDKNFVTLLEERNLKIRYEFEESGRKKIKICIEEGSCVIWTSLKRIFRKRNRPIISQNFAKKCGHRNIRLLSLCQSFHQRDYYTSKSHVTLSLIQATLLSKVRISGKRSWS